MTKEETEIQKQIMLALSQYGICIRQNSGLFYTEHGSRIRIGFPGISDLQFISDDGNLTCFIEIKRPKKGVISDEQRKFVDFINSKNSKNLKAGYARSVEEALKLIGVE